MLRKTVRRVMRPPSKPQQSVAQPWRYTTDCKDERAAGLVYTARGIMRDDSPWYAPRSRLPKHQRNHAMRPHPLATATMIITCGVLLSAADAPKPGSDWPQF